MPWLLQATPVGKVYTFHHENVLGSSCELTVVANSPEAAAGGEKRALAEVDRLAAIFSTYDGGSEFSRWQQTFQTPLKVSPELFEVLAACDTWREKSKGAFNPAVEALTRMWKAAEKQKRLPTDVEIEAARKLADAPSWSLDPASRTATHLSRAPLSLNAIAKGYILGKACAAILNPTQGTFGAAVMIGGDMRVLGDCEKRIGIADPQLPAENAKPISQVLVKGTALATSGSYRRGVDIAGKHYSHIIDPRNGLPAGHIATASVIAPDAAVADALATIFSILSPEESLLLARSIPGVELLVALANGKTVRSAGWVDREVQMANLANPVAAAQPGSDPGKAGSDPWAEGFSLMVNFEIDRPEGGRYLRPYVAVWIEDKDGFPVRTIGLWLMQGPKGLQYVPDLRRWYRSDQMRKLAEGTDLIASISSATRQPGKYSMVWDGKDDLKKPVKPGVYTFYFEAAREHGTYQLMKKEITIGNQPFTADLGGNIEIKGASLEYRKRGNTP